jgi:DNA-binding response OmpR family regulator
MSPEILICDDEPHITRAVALKLTRAGFNVHAYPHGLAAWHALPQIRPALLITDCQMPEMTGLELIARLRQTSDWAELPVILLTAKSHELADDETALAGLHIARVMTKPFSPRELLTTVQSLLETAAVDAGAESTACN